MKILQLTRVIIRGMGPDAAGRLFWTFVTSVWTYDLKLLRLRGSALEAIRELDATFCAVVILLILRPVFVSTTTPREVSTARLYRKRGLFRLDEPQLIQRIQVSAMTESQKCSE